MDKSWIGQTQRVVRDGVNTGFTPDQIGDAQVAWGLNQTIRDGKIRTRSYKLVQRALLPKGLVQGGGYFSVGNGQFVVSIWGQLWRILVNANNVTVDDIPLAFRNSSILTQAWCCETVGSFLIQDGQSACIIYDGSSARRAGVDEVPLGRMMAYGNGRLCVAVGRQLKVGDITTDTFQSELQFTENVYLNGGGAFLYSNPITGLAFLPVNNTFSGYGSLIVFGNEFSDSLHLEITERDRWASTDGFGVTVLPGIGTIGHDTIVPVNQDLYFRDSKGDIWSIRSASADQRGPGNSPLSREISRVVDFETDIWLAQSSGIYFDGRIMFLANPFNNIFGAASYQSIISLDAAPLATMRGKSPPAYDGIAQGLNFRRLMSGKINGQQRAFAISTDETGGNTLWEIVRQGESDEYFEPDDDDNITLAEQPVRASVETRRMEFGDPERLKQLMRCDLWPAEIEGEVSVTVYYRADNRSQWQEWDSFSMCAEMNNADNEWKNLDRQERGRVKSLTAPYVDDAIDKQTTTVGFGFQVRVVWNGQMRLDRIMLWAKPLDETAFSNIPDLETDCAQNVVVNNEVSYSIPVQTIGNPYINQGGAGYVDSFGIPYYQPV